MNSLTIFGPANSGKSSLCGYMYKINHPKFDFERFLSQVNAALGNKYDDAQRFAYIPDSSKDERIRQYFKKQGTSKHMHFNELDIGDLQAVVIDTPGAQHREAERLRGEFWGDIGLFMTELNSLVSYSLEDKHGLETLKEFFSPLRIWKRYPGKRKAIVVVSKVDKASFSEEKYRIALDVVARICGDLPIAIVPIALEVPTGIDHNIFTKSGKMPWYDKPTLWEEIDKVVKETSYEAMKDTQKPLLLNVDGADPAGAVDLVWRGKVLQGTLEKGSKIKLLPFATKNNNFSVSANVENVRTVHAKVKDTAPESHNVNFARKGAIVTIKLTDIKANNDRVESENLKAYLEKEEAKTAFIVNEETQLLVGDALQFEIPTQKRIFQYVEDVDVTKLKFNFLEALYVIWFGRRISARIVKKTQSGNHIILTLLLEKSQISFPYAEKDYESCLTKFILTKADKGERSDYFSAYLKKVGFPASISYEFPPNTDSQRIKTHFRDYAYELTPTAIIFKSDVVKENPWPLLERIKSFDLDGEIFSRVNIDLTEIKA